MRSLIVFVLALLLLAVPATAQDRVDYAIDHIRDPILNSDGSLVEVVFDVVNEGAVDASTTATVLVTNQQNGEQVARQTLEPLAAGAGVTVTLTIPVDELPQEGTQNLLLTVGIADGEVEPQSSGIDISNNIGHVMLRPLDQMQGQVQSTPEAQPTEAVPGETETPVPTPDTGLTILGFTFNTRDPLHVAALVAIALALLIMALLLIVIVRLLFRRRPVFQIEAPPYANMPMLATSTNAGRRQGWQFHAQNDLPPPHHAAEGENSHPQAADRHGWRQIRQLGDQRPAPEPVRSIWPHQPQ